MKQEERHSIEIQLLANLISNTSLLIENSSQLHDGLFATAENKRIYRAVEEIITQGIEVDAFEIARRSDVKLKTILSIIQDIGYEYNPLSIIANLNECYRLTVIRDMKCQLVDSDDSTRQVELIQNTLLSLNNSTTRNHQPIDELIHQIYQQIDNNQTGNRVTGIPTGLGWYDNFTGGLQNGDLVVIAGRTSQGKTSLALTIAFNASIRKKTRTLIVSQEMTNLQIIVRLAAMATGIGSKHILHGQLSTEQLELFNQKIKYILDSSIFMMDSPPVKIHELINRIKLSKITNNIQLVVIDYLQLFVVDDKKLNKEQETAKIARVFKNLAKELNIPVVLISQLRRSHDNDQKPRINELRDSGQIEEAADVILFVYRPETYGRDTYEFKGTDYVTRGLAFLEIAKGRNIGLDQGILNFEASTTYFTDYEENQHSTTAF